MGGCIYYLIEATKWLPVLITSTIYAWSWYAYVFQLVAFNMESVVQKTLCLIIFQILYTFSIWSYMKTIFTPNTRIPSKFHLTPEVIEDLTRAVNDQHRDEILAYVVKRNELPVYCRTFSGGIRYCEKCNIIKPDRCHHCSICRNCVLKMDHHCPWINNCVSFTNYKFFVLFLGYTFALCLFVAATSFPFFLQFWIPTNQGGPSSLNNGNNNNNGTINNQLLAGPQAGMSLIDDNPLGQPNSQQVPFGVKFQILFLFFVSGMMSMGIMFLYFYHIYLLLKNRSTLEAFRPPLMTYGPDRNAFNLGKKENLNQLFGRSKILWFMPIYTTEGSGLSYDLRPQLSYDEEARQELLNHNANVGDTNSNRINNNNNNNSPNDNNRQTNTDL